jgi:hypothetical protein
MKIYQYAENLPPLYDICLEQFKSKIPVDCEHIVFKNNPFPELDCFIDLRERSNPMRYKLLSQPGDIMWADADTIWGKGFPENIDRSKPWISSLDGKTPNTSVIISFGHWKWFQQIYEEYMAEKIKHTMTYMEVLARHEGEYRFLPKDSFYEINLGMTRNKDALAIGTENFSVNRDKNGEWKFSFLRGVV